MARIVYALSGQGRGHASRVLAISEALRRRGHEITFCCGGTARDILEARGEQVIEVPSLRQIMKDNRVRIGRTLLSNIGSIVRFRKIVDQLVEAIRSCRPDLLITDFEAFSPKAARELDIPVLSFNHQEVVTEMVYDLPVRYRATAALAALAIRLIAPRRPTHVLLTSFFYGRLRHPERTTLIPPIIRPEVRQLEPTTGDPILVYYNSAEGAQRVVDVLARVDASFILYNLPPPEQQRPYHNLTFKNPSIEEFANDLASCRAVICTAGYTLISESLHLGKPLLVVPNRGIFEQTLNALFVRRQGFGSAVIERALTVEDVQQFLTNIEEYRARMPRQDVLGNELAVAHIEGLLARSSGRSLPLEAPLELRTNGSSVGSYVAKAD